MLSSTTLGLGVVAVAVGILYAWRKCRVYKFFDTMGIKGPKPVPFMGNYLALSKLGFTQCQKEWEQEFGNVYGAYFGFRPTLFIQDLDMVRDVLVKYFAVFSNHSTVSNEKPWDNTLLNMKGDHWKHARRVLTPCFSTGKLKKTVPSILRAVNNLIANVKEKAESGEEVELKNIGGCYEMDMMAATVFGLQVDSLKNPQDPFVVHANKIMNPKAWIIMVTFLLPFLKPLLKLFGIQMIDRKSTDWFLRVADQAIEVRKTDSQSYSDVLQLMVDAERGEEGDADTEIFDRQQLQTSSSWTQKGLTRDEMKANCLGFLLGGYDTAATTFAFTLFSLAANPQCLAKAQQEIDMKIRKGRIDYESASTLQYLDMCISEILRLYPPGFMLDRRSTQATSIGGQLIPADTVVAVPVYAIHTDPAIWPDPLTFDPERHTSEKKAERHPYSYMPFGIGPRSCVGMRLSQLELKIALASILQHFSPVLCEKSVYPPKLIKFGRMGAVDGIWVKFKARS